MVVTSQLGSSSSSSGGGGSSSKHKTQDFAKQLKVK